MDKIFNITSLFKASDNGEDGSVTIKGMASTDDFDRAGDSIAAEAWTKGGLSSFIKNPIILFNHDYNKPIGRALNVEATVNGLALEAKISKSADNNVCELVKDGVLGAFSVGFRVKDADYISETDGLRIKDAELFEVSVVSVPCNQEATFSLAKSFNSESEYEDFKNTFTNRVELASQSLAKEDVNASKIASDTLTSAENSANEDVQMDKLELEAFAKKVSEQTAASIAMKHAEQKAAEEAAVKVAAEKAAEKAEAKAAAEAVVKVAVTSGAETLMADIDAKLAEKDANFAEIIATFKKDLEEKNDEITKMRDSKRQFSDREDNDSDVISKWGQEFMNAHMLGVMTNKGIETNYAKNLMEKAGMDWLSNADAIDTEVSSRIEKEIQHELKVAALFREVQVNSQATVLPIQPDTNLASWQAANGATSPNIGDGTDANLTDKAAGLANNFQISQVIMNTYRLISSTFMDNTVDEEVLVNLMPMLVESVARAHARAVESALLMGNGGTITGLDGLAATHSGLIDLSGATVEVATNSAQMTAAFLLAARAGMGTYGVNPEDVAYIVNQRSYYELLQDSAFQTLDEVGPMATKLKGMIGAVFGSPVIVSNEMGAAAAAAPAAFAVYSRNYVIPRLRGVTVEQDYEVMNQRRVIVATQNLGFTELVAGGASGEPVVKIDYTA